jgi:predicted permease
MTWFHRLRNTAQVEAQLDAELRFDYDQRVAANIRAGMDECEAHRAARLAFGGLEQIKEECRDARGTRWLLDLWQDFRYALGTLQQKPGFAAVAMLTLALGIGATTVLFTVINGVLLKPLPYPEPDRLVALNEWTDKPTQFGNLWAFTYPNFLDCKHESRSLTMAAWGGQSGTISRPGDAEHIDGFQVSADLFSVLGVSVTRGRAFQPQEDQPGAAPVAIIGHGLWQRRFGGSPAAIGATVVFEDKPYTIVGIAPAGLRLSPEQDADADIYFLAGQNTEPAMQNRFAHTVQAVGRLRRGATLAQAQAELASIGRHLAEEYPKSNEGRTMVAAQLRPDTGVDWTIRTEGSSAQHDAQSTLWLLLGAVSLVLLIACVNVASLLLARAVSREREIAMRVALGAGRNRIVRQCLTESAVLALCGGALGLALAALSIRPFIVFWPGSLPRAAEARLDWRVLLFALASSLLSGLLFGLAPAFRAPVRKLEQVLRAGGRTLAGNSRRLHSGFVISEIAFAVVLLVSAGMLGRTLIRLSSLDPGVNIRNVLVTRTALSPRSLATPAQIRAQWQEMLDRIRRVPGVQSVSMVDTVPMREGNNQLPWWTSAAMPPPNEQPLALATSVTPDYLKVMGIPLREGRFLNDQDRMGNELVIVIDDALARQAFGGRNAVGKRLWIPAMSSDPVRVIGVVGHVRHWGLAGDDQAQVRAQIYYPFDQVPDPLLRRWSELMSIAVRTSVEPLSLLDSLRREARGAAGDQVLYEARTMEQLASRSLARQRFLLLLFGIFAGLALLLACIGIYGVLAYLTSQRVPEIGVRMAIGASARDVVRLVLRQSAFMIIAGVVVGLAAALAAGRLLERLISGVRPADAWTFAATLSVIAIAALFASFLPARRASRIDPMSALRQE